MSKKCSVSLQSIFSQPLLLLELHQEKLESNSDSSEKRAKVKERLKKRSQKENKQESRG